MAESAAPAARFAPLQPTAKRPVRNYPLMLLPTQDDARVTYGDDFEDSVVAPRS